MNQKLPSDLAEKIVVRLPDGLRDRLAALAKARGRSANAEAVMALEDWVTREEITVRHGPADDETISILAEAIGKAIASSPKLIERYGVADALVATGRFERIKPERIDVQDEQGRALTPDDLLSSVGEVEGGEPYPRRVDGGPVSPEEEARRDKARRLSEKLRLRSSSRLPSDHG